ncbi:hypothetical protein U9M48_007273, partial [Paspalum notatum var. saurae]
VAQEGSAAPRALLPVSEPGNYTRTHTPSELRTSTNFTNTNTIRRPHILCSAYVRAYQPSPLSTPRTPRQRGHTWQLLSRPGTARAHGTREIFPSQSDSPRVCLRLTTSASGREALARAPLDVDARHAPESRSAGVAFGGARERARGERELIEDPRRPIERSGRRAARVWLASSSS